MTINTQKLRDGPYLRDGQETRKIMRDVADVLDRQAAEIERLRDDAARYPGGGAQDMISRPIIRTRSLPRQEAAYG